MISNQKNLISHFLKFSLVGVLNTILHLSFFSFFQFLGIHYIINQTISFLLVNIITFTINKIWTFQNKSKEIKKQFFSYIVTRTVSLFITLSLTILLVEKYQVSPFACQIINVFFNFIINFLAAQILIFANEETKPLTQYLSTSLTSLKNLNPSNITTVYYVIPVFGENKRVLPKTKNNNFGEDFIRIKINQLNELFCENKNFIWKILIVDDGDIINKSGEVIYDYLQKHFPDYLNTKIEVVFLSQLNPKIAKISRKGGAVIEGMKYVLNKANENDIIIYSDADLSTDLRLSGSLLKPLLNKKSICISSRWHPKSTVLNRGILARISSWFYNILVLFLIKLDITDSQNGFKAYNINILKKILPLSRDISFAFDTELLLLAKLFNEDAYEIPIFWTDSKMESNVNLLKDSSKMILALFQQKRYFKKLQKSFK